MLTYKTRGIGVAVVVVILAGLRFFDRTTQHQQNQRDQQANTIATIAASTTIWLNVELVAFERDGLRGQMPDGWIEEDDGTFVSPARDATFVVQKLPAVPLVLVVPVVMQNMGLDTQPEPHSERTANGIRWSLYSTTADRKPVDFAIGQGDGANVLLLLQSPRNQRDEFYEHRFLPMVDALEIVE